MPDESPPSFRSKPMESSWAFWTTALGALASAIAAAATIWVALVADRISQKQKTYDLVGSLAPLLVESDATKQAFALEVFTAFWRQNRDAVPDAVIGAVLVNRDYGAQPVQAELLRMSCIMPEVFQQLQSDPDDPSVQASAQRICEDAVSSRSCEPPAGAAAKIVARYCAAASAPVAAPVAPASVPAAAPAAVANAGFTVVVASQRAQQDAKAQCAQIAQQLASHEPPLRLSVRPPIGAHFWWGISIADHLALPDARADLAEARGLGYPDAFLTRTVEQGQPCTTP